MLLGRQAIIGGFGADDADHALQATHDKAPSEEGAVAQLQKLNWPGAIVHSALT